MRYQSLLPIIALMMAPLATIRVAGANEESKYPNLKGQWSVILVPGLGGQRVKFDPTKPWGRGQEAPLTPEYQKIHEDSMADQAKGGLGNYPTASCHPGGMPRMMSVGEYEYVVEPETTYVLIGGEDHYRRIFTDGRPWPAEIEPTYAGYSIGKWLDEDGHGRFDVLDVETRGPFKGPRAYDATGLPLHFDNQSIFKERFYLDKTDANVLHDMHYRDRPCVDATVDGRQDLSAQSQSASELARVLLHRGQRQCRHRQGKLFHERGWIPDAGQEGSGAARFAVLQANPKVTLIPPPDMGEGGAERAIFRR
jgi:hypothetical protein